MWEVVREVGNQILAVASTAAPDLSHEIVPTAEEAGFKLTVNLGQVLQLSGFAIFAFKYYTAVVVKHAVQAKDIEQLKLDVSTLMADIKDVKGDLKQLPAIMQGAHRIEERQTAVLGKLDNVPTRSDTVGTDDEFLTRLAEKLVEIGEARNK